jgi:CxxC-x17-CxxC domain-containing protein
MEIRDKQLKCVDCGRAFTFTAGEQHFFREKGLNNEPKRCKQCKAKQISQLAPTTEKGISYRVEATVTCSRCGKETTVPFVPKQGRPVLCRECYQERNTA